MRLNQINILGKVYKISYIDIPSEVDHNKRESLFGSIDYWKKSINIYNKLTKEDKFETLLHEVLHAIESDLRFECFNGDDGHDALDILALALADTLVRNGMIELMEDKNE